MTQTKHPHPSSADELDARADTYEEQQEDLLWQAIVDWVRKLNEFLADMCEDEPDMVDTEEEGVWCPVCDHNIMTDDREIITGECDDCHYA